MQLNGSQGKWLRKRISSEKSYTIDRSRNVFCDSVDDTITEPGNFIWVKGMAACFGDCSAPLDYADATGKVCECRIVSHLAIAKKFTKNGEQTQDLFSLGRGVRFTNITHRLDYRQRKQYAVSKNYNVPWATLEEQYYNIIDRVCSVYSSNIYVVSL